MDGNTRHKNFAENQIFLFTEILVICGGYAFYLGGAFGVVVEVVTQQYKLLELQNQGFLLRWGFRLEQFG